MWKCKMLPSSSTKRVKEKEIKHMKCAERIIFPSTSLIANVFSQTSRLTEPEVSQLQRTRRLPVTLKEHVCHLLFVGSQSRRTQKEVWWETEKKKELSSCVYLYTTVLRTFSWTIKVFLNVFSELIKIQRNVGGCRFYRGMTLTPT